jgi:putative MATE family efflux protein
MILDPILIFAGGMGVFGAAAATVAAQAAVLVIFLAAVKKSKDRPVGEYRFFAKPSSDKIIQIFKWSLPIACESTLFTVLSMTTTKFISPYGVDAIATQRVGTQIESLSWLIGGGFGSAVTAFTGQNFGAGKWSRIQRGFRVSTVAMLIWGIIVTVLFFFRGSQLFYIFLWDETPLEMSARFMQILVICQIATCLEGVSAGYFRGMGRTMPPTVTSIAFNLARVGLAYVLSLTSLGLYGVWLGVAVGALARGAAIFIWSFVDARKKPKADDII